MSITLKDKPPVAFFDRRTLEYLSVKHPWLKDMAEEVEVNEILLYRVSSERVYEIFPEGT